MEAIKKFDEYLKQMNSYYILTCNVLKYIASAFSIGIMIIFPVTDEDWFINFYLLVFFCYAITLHIRPYLYIKQNKVTVPICKLIRDTPIRRKEFIHSRLNYLYSFVAKIAFGCVTVRTFSILVLEDTLTLERVAISLLGISLFLGIATCIAVLDIYNTSRY